MPANAEIAAHQQDRFLLLEHLNQIPPKNRAEKAFITNFAGVENDKNGYQVVGLCSFAAFRYGIDKSPVPHSGMSRPSNIEAFGTGAELAHLHHGDKAFEAV
jgi:hypothetical protein